MIQFWYFKIFIQMEKFNNLDLKCTRYNCNCILKNMRIMLLETIKSLLSLF